MQSDDAGTGRGPSTAWTFNRLLLVLAFLVVPIALFVAGGFSVLLFVFVGPYLIPSVLFTVLLVWKPRPWLYLVTGIAISYLFILFLPFILPDLVNPANAYAFSGDVLGLMAVFWALPAGVLGFLRGRKGKPEPDARAGWRTREGLYAIAVASIAVGAILASALAYTHATGLPSGGGFDFEPSQTVSVTAQDFLFHPASFNVSVRTVVAIVVVNKDSALHTFTYEVGGRTYSHELLPGTSTRFLVFFDAVGSVPYWCIPHRSTGMTGTISAS